VEKERELLLENGHRMLHRCDAGSLVIGAESEEHGDHPLYLEFLQQTPRKRVLLEHEGKMILFLKAFLR
jgi:hypothetical protein